MSKDKINKLREEKRIDTISRVYKESIENIEQYNLITIASVSAYAGISRTYFWELFPKGSKEREHLTQLLRVNKVGVRTSILKKWNESDNFSAQLALFKLTGTEEDRRKLSTSFVPREKEKVETDNTIKIEIVKSKN